MLLVVSLVPVMVDMQMLPNQTRVMLAVGTLVLPMHRSCLCLFLDP